MMIREVWDENFEDEMNRIQFQMFTPHPLIAIDTEFPGFLYNSSRDASEEECYADLKFNVDNMELIQLGLIMCDDSGDIGDVWQVNFSNFDPIGDIHVPASLELLRRNGIDLEKNQRMGVDVHAFAERHKEMISVHENLHWVTLHGLYDLAYVPKILNMERELPNTLPEFAETIGDIFGNVYDVKFMARYCRSRLSGELGLERLSKILNVDRVGKAHQAGSDSLLTAKVFLKMKEVFGLGEGMYGG